MIKQIIDGLVADESELWTKFSDNIGPQDRVFRTEGGYIIVSDDEEAPEGAESIGSAHEFYA